MFHAAGADDHPVHRVRALMQGFQHNQQQFLIQAYDKPGGGEGWWIWDGNNRYREYSAVCAAQPGRYQGLVSCMVFRKDLPEETCIKACQSELSVAECVCVCACAICSCDHSMIHAALAVQCVSDERRATLQHIPTAALA